MCYLNRFEPPFGEKKYTLHLMPKSESFTYSYIEKVGLMSNKKGSTSLNKEVLPDLLAIKSGDLKALENFINNHGFFLTSRNLDAEIVVDAELIFQVISRLKTTVELMTAIVEEKPDFRRVLTLTLFLLLSPLTIVPLSGEDDVFATCLHDINFLWYREYYFEEEAGQLEQWNLVGGINKEVLPDIESAYKRRPEMRHSSQLFSVPDNIRLANVPYDEDSGNFSARISSLYTDQRITSFLCRLEIDFLYNFNKRVSEIESWDYATGLKIVDDTPDLFEEKFDEQLQVDLFKLAKRTLKTEIEYYLQGVTPSYDTELMLPTWTISNVLDGLFLSVFYINANDKVYKECQRDNCNKSFFVKRATTKQKYCSTKCANAESARMKRERDKKEDKKFLRS